MFDEGGGAAEPRVPCWEEQQTCCFVFLHNPVFLFLHNPVFLQLRLALVLGEQIAKAAGPEQDASLLQTEQS